jgi:acetylornithine/succinyldiaminopimelate/putrescine aminotransferase
MVQKYELVKEVCGKGLMPGSQFGAAKSLALKASWNIRARRRTMVARQKTYAENA